ncbi:hypothetical protein [Lacinutrix sp. Bg11-31]|uniref:hypothetical protein n=1 Tax=Lacinutrix sp. Bg11-31 TaxID=2057808 RepID=UPI000C31892F|nr:hypothetical protein [Lacinutrix sp. Bg11-31]AUC81477.1 hypothetical protein CW733_04770 [Lacinutrix sp. Bg11-31]
MKIASKLIVFVLFFFILNGCANSYKISTIDTVNVDDYSVYVFRLCEKIRVEGTQRFLLCDTDCKPNDINSLEGIQVREELYFLIEKQGNKVIYLTTKTDRSFDIEPDIFNSEAHKEFVFVDDLENVYYGILDKNSIIFTNKNEILKFEIAPREDSSCNYRISTLLSNSKEDPTVINNRLISLQDIYSVPLQFIKSERVLAIKENRKYELDSLQTIKLTGKRIVFKGKRDSIRRSQRKRLKYHPEFD